MFKAFWIFMAAKVSSNILVRLWDFIGDVEVKLGQRKEPQKQLHDGLGRWLRAKGTCCVLWFPFFHCGNKSIQLASRSQYSKHWGKFGQEGKVQTMEDLSFLVCSSSAQPASLHNPQLPAHRKILPTVNWALLSINNCHNLSWTCPQGYLVMTTTQLRLFCRVTLSCAVLIVRNN